jgi:tRNA A37 threonylcarbamoyladenosine dehydratase
MNERTVLLIGEEAFLRLRQSSVVIVGLGGVGGHCAEALVRAGLGHIHLVDYDTVQLSNLNRQLVAAKSSLGRLKTEAMQERLLDVSDCRVSIFTSQVDEHNVAAAIPETTNYIVDAIDRLNGKLALIRYAKEHDINIISCMGAGNRRDAAGFSVWDIYDTAGDPLAGRLRKALRLMGIKELDVVFSKEAPHRSPGQTVIGSLAPVTAAAGLVAASHVINRLTGYTLSKR